MKPTPTPDQLRPWPFHGYAPGGYLCTCRICSVSFQGDKRAMVCLSCAVVEAKKELAADLSAAPEGWRESLEKIAAMRWHEDADLDDICTIADRALSAALSVPAEEVVGEPIGYVSAPELMQLKTGVSCVDLFREPQPGGIDFAPVYAAPSAPEGMREAINKVLASEADFRSNMPADWQGDPLSDAIAELRKAIGGSHE